MAVIFPPIRRLPKIVAWNQVFLRNLKYTSDFLSPNCNMPLFRDRLKREIVGVRVRERVQSITRDYYCAIADHATSTSSGHMPFSNSTWYDYV